MNLLHHSYARGASLRFRPGSLLVIVVVSNEEGDAMTNEIIGILGVLGLTFLLFVLRHFILPSKRGIKHSYVAPIAPSKRESNRSPIDDDAWRLWTPNVKDELQLDRGQTNEPPGARTKEAVKTKLFEVKKSDDLEGNKESGRRSRHF